LIWHVFSAISFRIDIVLPEIALLNTYDYINMGKTGDSLKQALDYHQAGELSNAAALYLKIIKVNPQHVDVLFLLGTLYLQAGNADDAVTFLKKAIELKPDHVEAYNNYGTALQEQGKLKDAVESYSHALSLKPDFADAFFNLGNVFNKLHKTDKAIENYSKAALFNPDCAKAYCTLGTIFLEQGKLEDAATNLNKAKSINPESADVHNNLGIVLSKQGKTEEAISSFKYSINLNPGDHKTHSNLASALKESGRLKEAIVSSNEAIKLNPQNAEAYNTLGTIFQKSGNLEDAVESYKTAIEIRPENHEIHTNLGSALKELNRLEEAAACCRRAITINPEDTEAYNNLGTILQEEGLLEEATECYKQAICLNPNHAMAYSNLGTILQKQGKAEEAEVNCRQAVTLNPENAYFHNNLGAVLQEQEYFDEAIACHNRVIELDPEFAEAYSNLGVIFKNQGLSESALINLRKSLVLKPDNAEVHKIIGIILEEQGKTDEALFSYQESLRLKPDPGIEIKTALLHPIINNSQKSITQYRDNLFNRIESLKQKNLAIEDPPGQVGSTNFYLAYHGLNEKEIQEKVASLYMDVCPDLLWTSDNLDEKQPQPYEKINIGIISHYLNSHTIGQLNHGIIKHLSRERFHVTLFRFVGENEDSMSEAINSDADEVVVLPRKLKPARQIIAEHSLNILFYLDIGMDPLTYFMAFSRLAPIQCTTWGHPITTGIPNIDYFISSKMAEVAEAEEHYSEQLILPDRLTTYYYRPQLPEYQRSREYFGISENYNLYVCPQTLFKFHPDFDVILGDLLRKDKKGLLVLTEGKHAAWTEMLQDRFSGTFPDVTDRVKFLPRLPRDDYMSLLNIADVLLDPPHYGGGNTSLEAFAFGIPLVTLPGDFLRSRLTLALYRQMDIMDCVAYDAQTYIEIAYRLANDAAWRSEIADKINSKADCLFEDIETVHELERFFETAIQKIPNNNLLLEKQLT